MICPLSSLTISIHPMLFFIPYQFKMVWPATHFNTSYVIFYPIGALQPIIWSLNFNTSYVIFYLSFLFFYSISYPNFNTSYVIFYLFLRVYSLHLLLFQYILCYFLSEYSCPHLIVGAISIHPMLFFIRTRFWKAWCSEHISIHPMLFFISAEDVFLWWMEEFQYILCYFLSGFWK